MIDSVYIHIRRGFAQYLAMANMEIVPTVWRLVSAFWENRKDEPLSFLPTITEKLGTMVSPARYN